MTTDEKIALLRQALEMSISVLDRVSLSVGHVLGDDVRGLVRDSRITARRVLAVVPSPEPPAQRVVIVDVRDG